MDEDKDFLKDDEFVVADADEADGTNIQGSEPAEVIVDTADVIEIGEETEETQSQESYEEELERKKAAVLEAEALSQRMRDEYSRAIKAEKQRKKEENKKTQRRGISLGACIGISAAVSVGVIITLLVTLFFVRLPLVNMTIMDLVNSKWGTTEANRVTEHTPTDTVVGNTVVPGGSDVTINIDGSIEDNAAAVYAKCSQSIVGIRVVTSSSGAIWRGDGDSTVGEGSGVVYSSDGYIITNHHVIAEAISSSGGLAARYEIRVYFDTTLNTYCTAQIIGADATTDLALIKVDGKNLTPIEIESSEKLKVGDVVFAIGSPGGLEFMNSLSDGIISGLDREISTETGISYGLIQTNTAINPGNSGGALLNREGKLIGICFLKIVADGYEGMGFAISSDTVVEIIDELKVNGKISRPVLGITVNTLYNETEAQASGLPAGAWIEEVTRGSAADKAGIKANSIITEFNGEAIKNYTDLKTQLQKYKPGDTVKLKIYCYNSLMGSGEYKEYTVTLGEA